MRVTNLARSLIVAALSGTQMVRVDAEAEEAGQAIVGDARHRGVVRAAPHVIAEGALIVEDLFALRKAAICFGETVLVLRAMMLKNDRDVSCCFSPISTAKP